ncbi:hypothetical protein GCM10010197_36890 [Nocardioides luteus]|uniref:Uncharacterized protein n=1 Tax=Nocardioides luteus TaxID=1844 RepID=A0ABQ5SV06_9ACTN|nr:hypothetical protein GCM10010197_36890 [Nocardioides luteus]GLJ68022.1 hypothetical protein GCM10017579_20580 [Nocardioides luteus]
MPTFVATAWCRLRGNLPCRWTSFAVDFTVGGGVGEGDGDAAGFSLSPPHPASARVPVRTTAVRAAATRGKRDRRGLVLLLVMWGIRLIDLLRDRATIRTSTLVATLPGG